MEPPEDNKRYFPEQEERFSDNPSLEEWVQLPNVELVKDQLDDGIDVEGVRAQVLTGFAKTKDITHRLLSAILTTLRRTNPAGRVVYVSTTLSSTGQLRLNQGRPISIRLFASGADATCNIDGGNTITIRSGTGVDLNVAGNTGNPVVTWISGTLDVLITGLL